MEQLREGQEVIFTIKDKKYRYKVCINYIQKLEDGYNDEIFSDLKLDTKNFVNSAYGYISGEGNWPVSKHEDFAALTRLVENLFPYCDKVTVDDKVVYSLSKKPTFEEVPVPFFEVELYSSKSDFSNIINFESIVQTSKIKLTFI